MLRRELWYDERYTLMMRLAVGMLLSQCSLTWLGWCLGGNTAVMYICANMILVIVLRSMKNICFTIRTGLKDTGAERMAYTRGRHTSAR